MRKKVLDGAPNPVLLEFPNTERPLGVPPNPVVWLEALRSPSNEYFCMLDGPPKSPVPELAQSVAPKLPNDVPPNPVVWLGALGSLRNELCCMLDGPPKCPVPELAQLVPRKCRLGCPQNACDGLGVLPRSNPVCIKNISCLQELNKTKRYVMKNLNYYQICRNYYC